MRELPNQEGGLIQTVFLKTTSPAPKISEHEHEHTYKERVGYKHTQTNTKTTTTTKKKHSQTPKQTNKQQIRTGCRRRSAKLNDFRLHVYCFFFLIEVALFFGPHLRRVCLVRDREMYITSRQQRSVLLNALLNIL